MLDAGFYFMEHFAGATCEFTNVLQSTKQWRNEALHDIKSNVCVLYVLWSMYSQLLWIRSYEYFVYTTVHTRFLPLQGSLPDQQPVKSEATNNCLASLSLPSISRFSLTVSLRVRVRSSQAIPGHSQVKRRSRLQRCDLRRPHSPPPPALFINISTLSSILLWFHIFSLCTYEKIAYKTLSVPDCRRFCETVFTN